MESPAVGDTSTDSTSSRPPVQFESAYARRLFGVDGPTPSKPHTPATATYIPAFTRKNSYEQTMQPAQVQVPQSNLRSSRPKRKLGNLGKAQRARLSADGDGEDSTLRRLTPPEDPPSGGDETHADADLAGADERTYFPSTATMPAALHPHPSRSPFALYHTSPALLPPLRLGMNAEGKEDNPFYSSINQSLENIAISPHPVQTSTPYKPRVLQQNLERERDRPPLAERSVNHSNSPKKSASPKKEAPQAEPTPRRLFEKFDAMQSPMETEKKKSKHIYYVNKVQYERLSLLGRGGSSKVYRVMHTGTSQLFALKKVSFDSADGAAIAGYKGEIDLLRILSQNERVVKMIDAEIDDVKGNLFLIMEMGEIDLAHMLMDRANKPLDLNFVRYYWQQVAMAVHSLHTTTKIVHSDLKPANFLLIKGVLKLIDFGIAKTIGNDTTNIHRDTQIGTISYMSPEAILDTNGGIGGQRLMKLGKASDVWSCGCILYQMVYGRTPFSHLSMIQKIRAISDSKVPIDFPAAVGSVTVPESAKRCMVGCLQRDPKQRWTLERLLEDDFLQLDRRRDQVLINRNEIMSIMTIVLEKTRRGEGVDEEWMRRLAGEVYQRLL